MSVYTSCSDLPLIRFIRCLCNDDLTELVIDGQPSDEELQAAWEAIYYEYLDLSGNSEENHQSALMMEITQLHLRYAMTEESVNVLRRYRYDELVSMLKSAGHNFQFNHNDLEAYHRDLDRVLRRSKTLLVQKADKEAQLARLQEGQQGQRITRSFFDHRLNVLSSFNKFHINENEISVSRYVGLLNDYFSYCEHLKSKDAGRG